MNISSFYRVQLNKNFKFQDLEKIIYYLNDLGISSLYLSPILKSTTGSMHGYDVTDYSEINPEIGGEDGLLRLHKMLEKTNMNIMIDFVPNHMGLNHENVYLQDVFKFGKKSKYYNFFDLINTPDFPFESIIMPVLGNNYIDSLNDIKIDADKKIALINNQKFSLLNNLNYSNTDTDNIFSKDKILCEQYFRPMYWVNCISGTNYRRFFSVNSLIAVHSERRIYFKDMHKKIIELYKNKIIAAIRLDHIDGLFDPFSYLKNLKKRMKIPVYVEKILTGDEKLSPKFGVDGTTGYDFLYYTTYVFIDQTNAGKLREIYEDFTGNRNNLSEMLYLRKKFYIENYYRSELDYLSGIFYNNFIKHIYGHEATLAGTREMLLEIMANFPLYRIYISKNCNLTWFSDYIRGLNIKNNELGIMLNMLEKPDSNDYYCLKRLQQFLPAVMAKSMEDNIFFRYNLNIGKNEVGCNLFRDFITIDEFHDYNKYKALNYMNSINTLSTHDTKLGDDIRSRIITIYNDPDLWGSLIKNLHEISDNFKYKHNGIEIPDKNEEYYFYQILLAESPEYWEGTFIERVTGQMIKAVREAEIHTSWNFPNHDYEGHLKIFIERAIKSDTFKNIYMPFYRSLEYYGNLYSIMQNILKIMSPGIPDIYQGSEYLNNNFTDPDNRRSVNFGNLMKILNKIKKIDNIYECNINKMIISGELKMYVNHQLLNFRKEHNNIFSGDYIPLKCTGMLSDNVIAFERLYKGNKIIVIVSNKIATDLNGINEPVREFWGDAQIVLPRKYDLKDILTGRKYKSIQILKLSEIFDIFPFSVLFNGD
ncbi:malto-oligosyltrehalose synthase [Acidiplasma sp.]|uniref:malto-oligosyltrehalose synthase n=1 Tax=Acidiplasma sp. TaxID=1872114 RepID=UPI0031666458